jgi:hypothetical protein
MQTQELVILAVIFAAAVIEFYRAGATLRWLVLLALMRIDTVDFGRIGVNGLGSRAVRRAKWMITVGIISRSAKTTDNISHESN